MDIIIPESYLLPHYITTERIYQPLTMHILDIALYDQGQPDHNTVFKVPTHKIKDLKGALEVMKLNYNDLLLPLAS